MQREDIWKSKDGMDQAKWCIPRLREHTLAKEMGKFQRPRLKLHAVWVQQTGLYLNFVDPRQSSDATLIIEAACLALERVAELLEGKLPSHMSIMCDNTVRENKNNSLMRFISWAVCRYKFKSANIQMARVGHTHGPLGSLFAMCEAPFIWVTLEVI